MTRLAHLGTGMRGAFVALAGLLALLALLAIQAPHQASATVAGAVFTTFVDPTQCLDSPTGVDCNNYVSKDAVWVNGGPAGGPAALSDGTYFFTVVEPGGQPNPNDGGPHVLSDTDPAGGSGTTGGGDSYTNRTFTVSGGDITLYTPSPSPHASCQSNTIGRTCPGTDASNGAPADRGLLIQLIPYDDTSNPGGVYIMAICRIELGTYHPVTAPVGPAQCKYDAFRVQVVGVPPTLFGVVSGTKYYDADVDGQRDPGEPGLPNWPIDFTNALFDTLFTDVNGLFSVSLVAGTYTFSEQQATSPWLQTGNTVDQSDVTGGASVTLNTDMSYTVVVVDNSTASGLNFGNVCLGADGGRTLGFWTNKNGRAVMMDDGNLADELALLSSLNLRNANGSDFNPPNSNYSQFRNWLLNANAVNMAYMLSAQLAAMALNVEAEFVSGSALVFAPGLLPFAPITGLNALGFISIDDLMTAANAALDADGSTPAGDPNRAFQEALKDALDAANNNQNFVQPTPATCPTPVFP